MFLTKKINSSSITEVVIAMSIIAICFGVAAIVFTRSISVTENFQDFQLQTNIQGNIWRKLMDDNYSFEDQKVNFNSSNKTWSIQLIEFINNDNKTIWKQELTLNNNDY